MKPGEIGLLPTYISPEKREMIMAAKKKEKKTTAGKRSVDRSLESQIERLIQTSPPGTHQDALEMLENEPAAVIRLAFKLLLQKTQAGGVTLTKREQEMLDMVEDEDAKEDLRQKMLAKKEQARKNRE